MIGQVVVSCVPPGVRKAPIVGVFEWDGSAWDVIGEGVGVVRLSSSYEGQLRQTPAMMAAFPAMLLGMEQVDASARRKRTRIGARSIATAHYRTVRKTWPRATWHVHKRPEAPVLAVDGGKIVAAVAPFASDEVVAKLKSRAPMTAPVATPPAAVVSAEDAGPRGLAGTVDPEDVGSHGRTCAVDEVAPLVELLRSLGSDDLRLVGAILRELPVASLIARCEEVTRAGVEPLGSANFRTPPTPALVDARARLLSAVDAYRPIVGLPRRVRAGVGHYLRGEEG